MDQLDQLWKNNKIDELIEQSTIFIDEGNKFLEILDNAKIDVTKDKDYISKLYYMRL